MTKLSSIAYKQNLKNFGRPPADRPNGGTFDWDAHTPICPMCGLRSGSVRPDGCDTCAPLHRPRPIAGAVERPCEECNTVFVATMSTKRFCSERCQKRAKNRRAEERSRSRSKSCATCGIEFSPYRMQARYCSVACRRRGRTTYEVDRRVRVGRGTGGGVKHNIGVLAGRETEICETYLAGATLNDLAQAYDVTTRGIAAVLKRRGVEQHPQRTTAGRVMKRRLTVEQDQQIVTLHASGQTIAAIARQFGVSETLIRNTVRRTPVAS